MIVVNSVLTGPLMATIQLQLALWGQPYNPQWKWVWHPWTRICILLIKFTYKKDRHTARWTEDNNKNHLSIMRFYAHTQLKGLFNLHTLKKNTKSKYKTCEFLKQHMNTALTSRGWCFLQSYLHCLLLHFTWRSHKKQAKHMKTF